MGHPRHLVVGVGRPGVAAAQRGPPLRAPGPDPPRRPHDRRQAPADRGGQQRGRAHEPVSVGEGRPGPRGRPPPPAGERAARGRRQLRGPRRERLHHHRPDLVLRDHAGQRALRRFCVGTVAEHRRGALRGEGHNVVRPAHLRGAALGAPLRGRRVYQKEQHADQADCHRPGGPQARLPGLRWHGGALLVDAASGCQRLPGQAGARGCDPDVHGGLPQVRGPAPQLRLPDRGREELDPFHGFERERQAALRVQACATPDHCLCGQRQHDLPVTTPVCEQLPAPAAVPA
mmetsp:Transcript_55021/g.170432  ORF Transcript_55021/g.170432 Transcript_55021/m.170432 type:complete len:288 (-) Transcript_55021:371-1234(-)